MNEDRIWEMYYSDVYQPETVRACRERIHWLAERARGRVLDAGCSQGVLPLLLAREGHEVVGLDIEAAAIEFARGKLALEPDDVRARANFVTADLFTWEPDGRFDTVILGEVLEHVAKPAELLDAVYELLDRGGRLLITVPLGWLEHHDHKQAFLPTELLTLLAGKFGVDELDIRDDKIRLTATRDGADAIGAVDPRRLLAEVERALLDVQYRAVDLDRAKARRRDQLRTRIDELANQLRAARAKLADGQREKRRLGKRIGELQTRVDKLIAQKERLRQSGPFQLGKLLVGVGRQPESIFRLPDRLAALGIEHIRRRRLSSAPIGSAADASRVRIHDVYAGRYRIALPRARPLTDAVDNRILHLLEYSLPHHQNGYTLRSYQIVRAQRDHGWDPVVVTRPGFPEEATGDGPEEVAGVPHYRLRGDALNGEPTLPSYVHAYVSEAAEVLERVKPSIIQAGSNFRNAYAAMELARNYRLPFVYEVRGLWEETRVANGRLARGDDKYNLLVDVENFCMGQADAVITLGESLKAELVRRGIAAEKIFLVRNAVDIDAVSPRPPRHDLRTSLGLDDKFVVSYLGSVTRLESLDMLVEAIGVLRRSRDDVAALIVGGGAEVGELVALAARLGVSDRVVCVGRVPYDEIADYYAISDAVACTRGRERVCQTVTPLKPYEAMAYGLPVIVSDVPALREMVADGETGRVVAAEDPVELARAIAELADDRASAAALGERGRAWVAENRNWQRVTSEYRTAYEYAREAFARRS